MSTLLYALVALFVVAGAAYLYQLAIAWIPLIYINFLLTIGFGLVVGIIGAMVVKRGHCRNVVLASLLALTLAFFGIGVKHWFQYAHRRGIVAELVEEVAREHPGGDGEVAFQFAFPDYIRMRVEEGWSIGRFGRNGAPIAGWFVWLIWAIEASIAIYYAWTLTRGEAKSPYSESHAEWADEEEVIGLVPVTSTVAASVADASQLQQLLDTPPTTDQSTNTLLQYKMHSIPGQEMEDAYLSVDKITVKVNNKGETSQDEDSIFQYAVVNSGQRRAITERLAETLSQLTSEDGTADVTPEGEDDVS